MFLRQTFYMFTINPNDDAQEIKAGHSAMLNSV